MGKNPTSSSLENLDRWKLVRTGEGTGCQYLWNISSSSILTYQPAPPPPAWGVRIRQHNLPRQERGAVPPIRWFWAGGLQWDIRTRFWRSNVLLHVLQPIYHSRRFNLQDDICYFGMLGPMMRKKCIILIIPSKITMRCAIPRLEAWHLSIFLEQRIWESKQAFFAVFFGSSDLVLIWGSLFRQIVLYASKARP